MNVGRGIYRLEQRWKRFEIAAQFRRTRESSERRLRSSDTEENSRRLVSDTSLSSSSRMAGIDVLRGLMLAIVLVDHIDFMSGRSGSISRWTLMGLGLSDAADVFVFLSGFVFGVAYGKRVEREGRWFSLRHGLFRTLQIYMGFAACAVLSGLLQIAAETMAWGEQWNDWVANLYLLRQPANTGILCLYIVLLPWLLIWLVLMPQRLWWVGVSVSLGAYVAIQLAKWDSWLLIRNWGFQPLAWQFLMMFAAIHGRVFAARGSTVWPRSRVLFGGAILVLVFGLLVQKRAGFSTGWLDDFVADPPDEWVNKSRWAPLRGVHHLSLVYVTVFVLPLSSSLWSSRLLEPFRICGQHSLTIYCAGVVMAQLASIIFRWMGNSPIEVWLIAADAVFIQCFLAWFLERRFKR